MYFGAFLGSGLWYSYLSILQPFFLKGKCVCTTTELRAILHFSGLCITRNKRKCSQTFFQCRVSDHLMTSIEKYRTNKGCLVLIHYVPKLALICLAPISVHLIPSTGAEEETSEEESKKCRFWPSLFSWVPLCGPQRPSLMRNSRFVYGNKFWSRKKRGTCSDKRQIFIWIKRRLIELKFMGPDVISYIFNTIVQGGYEFNVTFGWLSSFFAYGISIKPWPHKKTRLRSRCFFCFFGIPQNRARHCYGATETRLVWSAQLKCKTIALPHCGRECAWCGSAFGVINHPQKNTEYVWHWHVIRQKNRTGFNFLWNAKCTPGKYARCKRYTLEALIRSLRTWKRWTQATRCVSAFTGETRACAWLIPPHSKVVTCISVLVVSLHVFDPFSLAGPVRIMQPNLVVFLQFCSFLYFSSLAVLPSQKKTFLSPTDAKRNDWTHTHTHTHARTPLCDIHMHLATHHN